MAKETRTIRVGPKAALHMIKSQAGTLGKAILEYCMNSCDSGSSRVDIDLATDKVVITDDGRGFGSREDIETFFEVLCFDHGPESEDWRTYGRFGMGRAMLFEFAATEWRTRAFKMFVDIRNRGLDYDLEDGLSDSPGCRVVGSFYNPLSSSDIYQVTAELKDMALYCPIPVYINGEQITADPEQEDWDYITDEAYIRLQPNGDMAVYNLGILVRRYGGYFFGQGGVVVSRKQLDVNFARNDVMQSRCPVWKKIAPKIKSEAWEKAKSKPTLTDAERQRIIADWIAGEKDWFEVRELALIKSVTGRACKVSSVFGYRNGLSVALCPGKKKMVGDILHRRKLAWVMAPEMFSWFGLANSGAGQEEKEQALSDRLSSLLPDRLADTGQLRPMSELSDLVDERHEILDSKDLNKRDKAILKALQSMGWDMAIEASRRWDMGQLEGRAIKLGRSDSYLGWTDGAEFIVIERRHARKIQKGLDGVGEVMHTLIHEQSHLTPSSGEHDHNQDFYERFHDLSRAQGTLTRKLISAITKQFRAAGFKLNASLMKVADLHQQTVGYSDLDESAIAVEPKPAAKQPARKPAQRPQRPQRPEPNTAQVDLFDG